jgi:hypothetical protein
MPPKREIAMTADTCPLDDEQLEHAVLMEIIELHPTNPTLDELHLALSYSRVELGRHTVEDSLGALGRFGLVRENEKVLEPTLAALHAAEVIQRG